MKLKLDITFNLDYSLGCGQVFRFKKQQDWWYGLFCDKIFKIRQTNNYLEYEGADTTFVKTFFNLNDDLPKITQHINKDPYIGAAIKQFEGLRLVNQDPWECLISYICATNKNIAAIEKTLFKLSQKYGEKRYFTNKNFWLFPSTEKLAQASIQDLKTCGLGYRAKYVQATAKQILDKQIKLEELKMLPYTEAKKRLLEFSGVGLKVADCVLLFSLQKTEAFPVDVWIKRILLNHYTKHLPHNLVKHLKCQDSLSNGEYEKLGLFGREYFGNYAGYAQEYLYHYERNKNNTTNM
ncbi:MAG: hypothetical protein FWH37_06240 [Candidatus Bathyarchaeota archaeon]|nr:hypothetical protein [Candidatus Termiticorpusculum sp.]